MPIRPGVKGDAAMFGDFEKNSRGVATAPVSLEAHNPERYYEGLTRMVRITNRGEKGCLKGRPYMDCANGALYPEGADPEDESTWLLVGESMLVPREAALFMVGDCFSPNNAKLDGPDIVRRFGDFQYKAPPNGLHTGPQNVPAIKVGPPLQFPDLLIEQVDSRGRTIGEKHSIWDLYIAPSEKQFRPEAVPA